MLRVLVQSTILTHPLRTPTPRSAVRASPSTPGLQRRRRSTRTRTASTTARMKRRAQWLTSSLRQARPQALGLAPCSPGRSRGRSKVTHGVRAATCGTCTCRHTAHSHATHSAARALLDHAGGTQGTRRWGGVGLARLRWSHGRDCCWVVLACLLVLVRCATLIARALAAELQRFECRES